MLKLFGIYSEDPEEYKKAIETKKEKGRNASVIDTRPMKRNIPNY